MQPYYSRNCHRRYRIACNRWPFPRCRVARTTLTPPSRGHANGCFDTRHIHAGTLPIDACSGSRGNQALGSRPCSNMLSIIKELRLAPETVILSCHSSSTAAVMNFKRRLLASSDLSFIRSLSRLPRHCQTLSTPSNETAIVLVSILKSGSGIKKNFGASSSCPFQKCLRPARFGFLSTP